MNEKVYTGNLPQNKMGKGMWLEYRQNKAIHESIIVEVHGGSLYVLRCFCIYSKLPIVKKKKKTLKQIIQAKQEKKEQHEKFYLFSY